MYHSKIIYNWLKNQPLSKVERDLFNINVGFINHKTIIIKKIGVTGLHNLFHQVRIKEFIKRIYLKEIIKRIYHNSR
jgi:hypothetical protein